MVSKNILRDIIVSNEEFILKQINKIVDREGLLFPQTLNKSVVLYGVRRSGKTFILFNLFKSNRERALYVDFEDERLLGFGLKDFEELKDVMLEMKPDLVEEELVFLLDEVQNIEGWERFCRRAVERENIRVFVSGSSSKMMPSEIQTELRGRSWSVEVFPFSFREYLRAEDIDTTDKNLLYGPRKAILKKYFSEYMKWGGFPEVSLLKSDLEKTKLIKEYFSAMYFRDLVERYTIRNIPLLESLTDKLFSSFSLKFSLNAFYKQNKDRFPFSKDLLFRYYRHFLQSMLVFEVRKFAESKYTRMRNPAKVYLVDTGLCRRITSADAGRLLENIVFLELRRRGCEVFYFEEERECDFIARTDEGRLLAVQVCFELNEEDTEREIGGLIQACRWLNINDGTILTYGDEKDLRIDGINIEVHPVWKWLLQHRSAQ